MALSIGTPWRIPSESDGGISGIRNKGLNDRQKRSFLVPFLNSANFMNGLLLSIIIDKKIKSFFEKKGTLNKNNPDLENFKNWKISSIEKMLRTSIL